ncbi:MULTISPECIES: FUSC family protein [Flagellimonas]|uniref:FUSC family protein n=2 Tax=Flagellimonas TaxID=444459 RepID=A0ABT5XTK6_9FLAO|nr:MULTISPECIES: FUSC family protein [Allomuricauda]MDF0709222.1 FUSC family protein [[Muricauda] okinawensis]
MMKPLSSVSKNFDRSFFIYLTRCIIGFLIGYYLMIAFSSEDFFWALLSIILVIPPEGRKLAPKLTKERVISNFIGSLSGLTVFFINIDYVAKVVLGIVVTTIICKLFKLMQVVRPAIVALLIILIEHPGSIISPFERFVTVLIGCLIGLSVTLITSFIIRKTRI